VFAAVEIVRFLEPAIIVFPPLPDAELQRDNPLVGALKMVTAKPKLSQQTFDHMRHLIQEIQQTAETQKDAAIQAKMELLDALLLRFVEDLIMEGSITVPSPSQSP
jgi:hypothetical protein